MTVWYAGAYAPAYQTNRIEINIKEKIVLQIGYL